jgi:hypothetical protein
MIALGRGFKAGHKQGLIVSGIAASHAQGRKAAKLVGEQITVFLTAFRTAPVDFSIGIFHNFSQSFLALLSSIFLISFPLYRKNHSFLSAKPEKA